MQLEPVAYGGNIADVIGHLRANELRLFTAINSLEVRMSIMEDKKRWLERRLRDLETGDVSRETGEDYDGDSAE